MCLNQPFPSPGISTFLATMSILPIIPTTSDTCMLSILTEQPTSVDKGYFII